MNKFDNLNFILFLFYHIIEKIFDMTKAEFAKKLLDVNNDIKKGEGLLHNLTHSTIPKAEKFVNNCKLNKDYVIYIKMNLTISNLLGSKSFKDLPFISQVQVLKCVVNSIKQYKIELATKVDELK